MIYRWPDEITDDELFSSWTKIEVDSSIESEVHCPSNAIRFMNEFMNTDLPTMIQNERLDKLEQKLEFLEDLKAHFNDKAIEEWLLKK